MSRMIRGYAQGVRPGGTILIWAYARTKRLRTSALVYLKIDCISMWLMTKHNFYHFSSYIQLSLTSLKNQSPITQPKTTSSKTISILAVEPFSDNPIKSPKCTVTAVKHGYNKTKIHFLVRHRCTRFENPEGGSMRFLPNFGMEGIQGL